MAQTILVKFDGVAGDSPSDLVTEAHREELSRYEQMLEVTSWSNRLDSRQQEVIQQIKNLLEELGAVRTRRISIIPKDFEEKLRTLREDLIPELIELSVVAADQVYFVDRYAHELRGKLAASQKELRELKAFWLNRLSRLPSKVIRKLGLTLPAKESVEVSEKNQNLEGEQEFSNKQLRMDYLVYDHYDRDGLVDNQGTPIAAFDNWVTSFHHQGKTYGGNNAVYSDLSERIFDLNKVFRLKGKRVLEIGPFEGSNTKQLFDLGVDSIVAIESNKEFFLKCLTLKEAFAWEKLSLMLGDCNKLLSNNERFPKDSFDLCYASGVLYHMSNPLISIELFTATSACVYVNSHVASDEVPKGEWLEVHDSSGRAYTCRRNVYDTEKHWGGVDSSAVWLTRDSMFQAFENHGFQVTLLDESENKVRGNYVTFLAKRR